MKKFYLYQAPGDIGIEIIIDQEIDAPTLPSFFYFKDLTAMGSGRRIWFNNIENVYSWFHDINNVEEKFVLKEVLTRADLRTRLFIDSL